MSDKFLDALARAEELLDQHKWGKNYEEAMRLQAQLAEAVEVLRSVEENADPHGLEREYVSVKTKSFNSIGNFFTKLEGAK